VNCFTPLNRLLGHSGEPSGNGCADTFRQAPSPTEVSPCKAVVEPIIDRGSFPIRHFKCQRLVFLGGQRWPVMGS
jgi:hypothetical protein